MISNFYTEQELKQLGFRRCGSDVHISRKCSIYGAEEIVIGDHVRIDDFTILSGKITIGNYVHISAFCVLYGRFGIEIGNFCGISPHSMLFSASDDFSGSYMISPLVPDELTNLTKGKISMQDYCQVGAASMVMPGVTMHEGSVCGAYTFVNHSLERWTINIGVPARFLRARDTLVKQKSAGLLSPP